MIIYWFAGVIATIIMLLLAKYINKNIQPVITKSQALIFSIIGLVPVVGLLVVLIVLLALLYIIFEEKLTDPW